MQRIENDLHCLAVLVFQYETGEQNCMKCEKLCPRDMRWAKTAHNYFVICLYEFWLNCIKNKNIPFLYRLFIKITLIKLNTNWIL